jgi:hypothetical protein
MLEDGRLDASKDWSGASLALLSAIKNADTFIGADLS